MKSTFPGLPTEIGTEEEVALAQYTLRKELNRTRAMLASVCYQLDNLGALCEDIASTPFGDEVDLITLNLFLKAYGKKIENISKGLTELI